jgi:acyl-CoA reductase-like NAD-dependent aldehyde dehydrogenase
MPAARELMLPETLRAASTGRHICADAATEALAVLGVLTMNSAAPYIAGGRWRTTPNTFAVSDPATDDVLAHVADCGPHETESAIQDAQNAFEGWARTPARARSDALRAWHDAILANAELLATVATAECGKPLAEARAEVAYAASFVEWFAEEAPRVAGELKSNIAQDRRLLTVRQPVGVAAAITPWNFPLAMITRKVAPAIAAGCPVVLKPSEYTPLTALALARLADGLLPPGASSVSARWRGGTEAHSSVSTQACST